MHGARTRCPAAAIPLPKGLVYICGRCGCTSEQPRKQNIQRHIDLSGCTGPGSPKPIVIDPLEWALLGQIRPLLTDEGRIMAKKARDARYYRGRGKVTRAEKRRQARSERPPQKDARRRHAQDSTEHEGSDPQVVVRRGV